MEWSSLFMVCFFRRSGQSFELIDRWLQAVPKVLGQTLGKLLWTVVSVY